MLTFSRILAHKHLFLVRIGNCKYLVAVHRVDDLPSSPFTIIAPRRDPMKKSELLRALQTEIRKQNLSTFIDTKNRVVVPGCPTCQKSFFTVEQFVGHLSDDVLPPLLDKLSAEPK